MKKFTLMLAAIVAAIALNTAPVFAQGQGCMSPNESQLVLGQCSCVDPGATQGPPCSPHSMGANWTGAAHGA